MDVLPGAIFLWSTRFYNSFPFLDETRLNSYYHYSMKIKIKRSRFLNCFEQT